MRREDADHAALLAVRLGGAQDPGVIPKAGPLSRNDLLAVWRAALDKGYRDPITEAGEGRGLEAHTQGHAVLARASTAIDRTTQAMFILPWSGQTNPPASGARRARVVLTFERTKRVSQPTLLAKGQIYVEERQTDWSVTGPVEVLTGRRYVLTQNLVFNPGDVGPFDVEAEAELVGDGHNNPLPRTISDVSQPASLFENDHATILVAPFVGPGLGPSATVRVVTPNEPDTFVPEHVGQYVLFTGGTNVGKVGRIIDFAGPDLVATPAVGSSVQLEIMQAFEAATFAGSYTLGETVNFAGTATGIIAGERVVDGKKRVSFVLTHATAPTNPAVGVVATGIQSGATATVQSVLSDQRFTGEAPSSPGVGGASWRILGWSSDWGLAATNALSPTDGAHAWLDELGGERGIDRASGELDDSYRRRVAAVADVVSPNAIRRALNRSLGSLPWCFREVGTTELPGIFFDGDGSGPHASAGGSVNDAYDTDVILLTGSVTSGVFLRDEPVVLEELPGSLVFAKGYFGRIAGGVTFTLIRKTGRLPSFAAPTTQVRGLSSGATFGASSGSIPTSVDTRRYRAWLDYSQFRGFFLVGLPPMSIGEFGFAYDAGAHDAYDASPYGAFFDGYPAGASAIYSRAYQAIDPIRVGGVLWEPYVERIGCP